MKASLIAVRIAPKKAALVAAMVRGLSAAEAIAMLARTQKKGARLIEALLKSAVANAEHNDKQQAENLIIKTLKVDKAQSYRRGVPMARGRQRPIRKFLSHIVLELGVRGEEDLKSKKSKKSAPKASQEAKKSVKGVGSKKAKEKKSSRSSDSSVSSSSL
ncbi:MAG: 50S ribosomal protein L22 [Candidatus Peribacteraceae bacterium]|nr:50S ribosomal protein L22 [Candidatus Peribacteraceae bacterium]